MNATVSIKLVEGPLGASSHRPTAGAGAWVVFEGVVRPTEDGRTLAALDYEHYPPMTERELKRLAERIAEEGRLLAMHVEHSVGPVAVGETSFRLSVAAAHRAEALSATDSFIAEMKRTVPLWKNPRFG
ncbi:Molybdopterin synthase catalytic subunit [Planctomycetes bacterium MalM25]|nr:Molybdopterin synthase catalytic subunit [Planctomycetes bacterium MalM25]